MSPPSPTFQQPPVSPVNIVDGTRHSIPQFPVVSPLLNNEKKEPLTTSRSIRSGSDSSSSTVSLSSPRKARFAEATSVYSPVQGPGEHKSPFSGPPAFAKMAAKPSDVGFGYISDNGPVEQHATMPASYNKDDQPLKSALKTPGTAARFIDMRSPTFREEEMLDKEEEKTERQQAKDLKVKTRVRMAKMVLRGVNFSCSLIVLSMVSTTFMVFNATKSLPTRNGLPAWAPGTNPWPQIVVLSVAAVSLTMSVVIMAAYCRRGGHKRAEKVAVYYTMFALGYFVFSIVMWLVSAAVLQTSKANTGGSDIWGWSCKENKRSQLFKDDVHYALVCRLQDWSLVCCIIEIVVEMIVIAIYGVVFYRFYSKNKLRKSMDARDKARSDLYLAQLRSQSAPNTPGFYPPQTPRTPRFIAPMSEVKEDPHSAAENGYAPSYTAPPPSSPQTTFKLQAPPAKHTPKQTPVITVSSPDLQDSRHEHVAAAPGEQVYESVPIPGAYAPTTTQH